MNREKQNGATTLIIAILLLIILSVVTLFTLNVGFFEARTTGNENRARIIAQAAEAGLNHGVEVIKANSGNLTVPQATSSDGWREFWTPCVDASFPCGAESDPVRRATLMRYNHNDHGTTLVGAGAEYEPVFEQVAGFDVDYTVGALLCLVDSVASSECVTGVGRFDSDDFSGLVSITLVSAGTLADDPAAQATVKATIASYREFGNAPNVPLIASGAVNLAGGTADVVPNPNAGGIGVALSVWTADEVDLDGGAVKTCHLGEFLQNYTGNTGASEYEGILICHDCRCDGLDWEKGLLSGMDSGERIINYDMLHVYTEGPGRTDVLPPNTYFPDARTGLDDPDDPLDDNLFEYVFGIDVVEADGVTCVSKDEDDKCPDTLYLEERAEKVLCADLGPTSAGLLWSTEAECGLPRGDIGSPRNPVFLVVDGSFKSMANTVFYGVFFKRNDVGTVDGGSDGATRGGATFYGSVVVDGPIRVRGTPKFIYNEAVLNNLLNSDAFTRFGTVPGSWTDVSVTVE